MRFVTCWKHRNTWYYIASVLVGVSPTRPLLQSPLSISGCTITRLLSCSATGAIASHLMQRRRHVSRVMRLFAKSRRRELGPRGALTGPCSTQAFGDICLGLWPNRPVSVHTARADPAVPASCLRVWRSWRPLMLGFGPASVSVSASELAKIRDGRVTHVVPHGTSWVRLRSCLSRLALFGALVGAYTSAPRKRPLVYSWLSFNTPLPGLRLI